MKKRTLLSLLAIPIFSVATTFNSFSQKFEEVGAGVIDFLLENPKTADKMKPSEGVALEIISDLLKTQGQRKHEIEYAIAGKDQITINTNDGRQAQFVKDESGNIFLVVEGVIHPIAKELINQASNIPNIDKTTLPPYNLKDLESKFNYHPIKDLSQYYSVPKEGEYLSDIAKKFDVPESNIFYCWGGKKKFAPITNREVLENRKKMQKGGYRTLRIINAKFINEISTIFSYKWHQDLNNDGVLGFNEFNQIKRTFYDDEDFNIAIRYQTEKGFKGDLEIKIFEDYTGKPMFDKKWELIPLFSGRSMIRYPHISAGLLPVGLYLIHTNLINDNSNTLSSKSERLEIIQSASKTIE
ncbi:MAG: hypothetical protein ISS82_05625 [Nanoarchaeota archaeon]|nr:hypothetical protein [Nanoarchaeota archaeon]